MRREFFLPVGLFGIAVTTGLLAYELFGIKKCHALLKAGRELECKLDLPVSEETTVPAGQFLRRPKHLLGLVNEPFAAAPSTPPCLPRGPTWRSTSKTPSAAGPSASKSSS